MPSEERGLEDAAKWQEFDRTVGEVWERFADLSEDDLQALIDEAMSATRRAGDVPEFHQGYAGL